MVTNICIAFRRHTFRDESLHYFSDDGHISDFCDCLLGQSQGHNCCYCRLYIFMVDSPDTLEYSIFNSSGQVDQVFTFT